MSHEIIRHLKSLKLHGMAQCWPELVAQNRITKFETEHRILAWPLDHLPQPCTRWSVKCLLAVRRWHCLAFVACGQDSSADDVDAVEGFWWCLSPAFELNP